MPPTSHGCWMYADRPRERLVRYGAGVLSTQELLTLLIASGTAGTSATSIAETLTTRFPTLPDLAGRDVAELRAIRGMGTAKASTLCAAFELAHRIQSAPFDERPSITTPASVARLLTPHMRHLRTEQFRVVLLNSANQIIRIVDVSSGSLNAVMIHPREVFRIAIAENAASVILVHNHPSGNIEPSREDCAITRQLVDAGRIVDIRVLDHIIIGGDAFTSFADRHML